MRTKIKSRAALYFEVRRVYDAASSGMGASAYEVRELSEYLHKIWTDLSEPERSQVNAWLRGEGV